MRNINETEINFSIRFIGVTLGVAEEIESQCYNMTCVRCPYFKDKSLFVVSIDINENFQVETVLHIMRENEGKYLRADLFVSINSDLDTQILSFPDFAVSAIRILSVGVTLSYTIFPDQD